MLPRNIHQRCLLMPSVDASQAAGKTHY